MTEQELIQLVLGFGRTDESYLRWHARRFVLTKQLVESSLAGRGPQRILDIGAHWLHQAVLYAAAGHRVTAAEIAGIPNMESVQTMAAAHHIELYTISDLARQDVLDGLPEASYDRVLFTEVLEHITFNPVAMWQAIRRVLKPRGKVIVTTPNYYFSRSRAWDPGRFIGRMGGGITVDDIVGMITYGHHWKEYSSREIIRYFSLLPCGFRVADIRYINVNDHHRAANRSLVNRSLSVLERRIGILRDTIYAEVVVS